MRKCLKYEKGMLNALQSMRSYYHVGAVAAERPDDGLMVASCWMGPVQALRGGLAISAMAL
jgi:hypothetical protein